LRTIRFRPCRSEPPPVRTLRRAEAREAGRKERERPPLSRQNRLDLTGACVTALFCQRDRAVGLSEPPPDATYNRKGRPGETPMPPRTLTVNGSKRSVDAPPEESLLSVLRNRLDLTGTKYGCGEGQCGACTVLVDGRPTRSCRTSLSEVAGSKITTIEGLASNGRLHP